MPAEHVSMYTSESVSTYYEMKTKSGVNNQNNEIGKRWSEFTRVLGSSH